MGGRRRGISFGTVLAILLTAAVVGGCLIVVPRMVDRPEDIRVNAYQFMNVIGSSLSLPTLMIASPAPATALPVIAQPFATAQADAAGGIQPQPTAMTPPPETAVPAAAPPTQTPESVSFQAATQAPATGERMLTFTFAGSIAFEDSIQATAFDQADKTYDFTGILSAVSDEMRGEVRMATLENILLGSAAKLSDVNAPAEALAAVRESGLNVLALGVENALDYADTGVRATLAAVQEAGLASAGLYAPEDSAGHARLMTVGGVRVALLHYTDVLSGTGKRKVTQEQRDAMLPEGDLARIGADIAQARANGAKVVIVSLHWGSEGATAPSGAQREKAQAIADLGADLLIGAHSEAVQPVEMLTGTRADGTQHPMLAAYSLGALLCEERERKNISGLLLHVRMTYDLAADAVRFDEITYTPTYIWRQTVGGARQYRVLPSDLAPPEAMNSDQQGVMSRSLQYIKEIMRDAPATLRTAGE